MQLTEDAKKVWSSLRGRTQLKLLNYVWCRYCHDLNAMVAETMQVRSHSDLLIRGRCLVCGEAIHQTVELPLAKVASSQLVSSLKQDS